MKEQLKINTRKNIWGPKTSVIGKKCFVWCFECKYCEVSENIFSTSAFFLHFSHCKFYLFKALALWVEMFVCLYVCLSICLSVCSLLRYRLSVFLPPLPEVRCTIFLEIQNPWGKVMERSGLRFEHFCLQVV